MDNKWYQKGLDWLLEKDNVDKNGIKEELFGLLPLSWLYL